MKTKFKEDFLKEIKKLRDKTLVLRIKSVIEQVEAAENIAAIKQLKKLQGFERHYRIRVSDYQIGIIIDGDTVFFATVAHRKDIYKRFP